MASIKQRDSFDLNITDLAHDGKGIGHVDGWTVFVAGALPGDRILAQLTLEKKQYGVAEITKILQPSPDRISPLCPVADRCGGCSLQTLALPAQLVWKRKRVVDALERIAHIHEAQKLVTPVLGMAQPWHYRSKVQLPVQGTAQKPQIGFYEQGTHRVVDTAVCPVQPLVCDRIRETVRTHIQKNRLEPYQEKTGQGLIRHLTMRVGFASGDIQVGLIVKDRRSIAEEELIRALEKTLHAPDTVLPQTQLAALTIGYNPEQTNRVQTADYRLASGQGWIREVINGISYRLSPLSFFQVNPRQTEKLFQTIQNMADLQGDEVVWDLYCGTGSIALQLASKAKRVIGVESVSEAIEDAKANAVINNMDNLHFICGQAETVAPQLIEAGQQPDLVVIDPPRKGCDPQLIETLKTVRPGRLIYVSCNPSTLARDLAKLTQDGYRVQSAQPVDLFPWTSHCEVIVKLIKA